MALRLTRPYHHSATVRMSMFANTRNAACRLTTLCNLSRGVYQIKLFHSAGGNAWRLPKQKFRQNVQSRLKVDAAGPNYTMLSNDHLLTLSCPDREGIVYAVTGILFNNNLTILDLQQFSDPSTKKFFMRVHFGHTETTSNLTESFEKLSRDFSFDEYEVKPVARKPRVLIMVSKIGHCLNDLLFRMSTGKLNIEVPAIVSNHPEFKTLAESYKIPFFHLPVNKDTKEQQEGQILDLVAEHKVDLIVLARYMQVLSPKLCSAMSGKIINIHHSFLPSFKGAKPYHQAFERGVKIIGATAHFVTADLDEGPIIEQNVTRVNHAVDAKDMVEAGSTVETQVLAVAVKRWSEGRVFLNGVKTVVFD